MGNVAASGGYWIGGLVPTKFLPKKIPSRVRLGCLAYCLTLKKLPTENGVTWDVVKTGELADIDTNVRPKTEAELAIYQKSVDKVYRLFLKKVSRYRNLPVEEVKEIAKGRVWSGKEAKDIGLVDRIGGLENAIAYAAEKSRTGQ